MLVYHPAFDIYHGVFRLLRILSLSPKQQFEMERIRILDFYLLFPNELLKFRFPAAMRKKRSLFQGANPYQSINDPKRVFFRLEPYQTCAIKCLVARQFVDTGLFFDGKVARTGKPLPDGLNLAIQKANQASPALIEFMNDSLLKIDLYGDSGLKGRSDLFEYRYDLKNPATSA
jgi:hypothetical protein